MDEDDFFSDDDLNDIPDNTLLELEKQAISSTQQQPPPQRYNAPKQAIPARPAVPLRKQAHTASSLNRPGSVNKNLPWRPPQPSARQPSQQQQQSIPSAPPASAPRPPSSDYGVDDEDVIDLDEPSMVIQPSDRPQPVRQNYNQQQSAATRYDSRDFEDDETAAAFAAADQELGSQTFGRWPQVRPAQSAANGGSMDVSALQARIAELEEEQARLRHAEQLAREEARAKQGEIAIVRSNQEKMTKQYEARISVMQRLHADEAAKAKADLDAQRKEREKMETDNRFLQHDLAQEAERAKRVAGPSRTKSTQRETPRRNKRAMMGDGFDDDEVRLASPTRSRDKSRGDNTPKAGAKRKRPANDSPVAPLSFTQPPQPVRHEITEQSAVSFESKTAEQVVVKDDSKYEFMQLILNHSPYEGHEGTVDSLAKYSFPSKPGRSLSSLLIHDISLHSPSDDEPLSLKVSRALLSMWTRCLEERYLAPFYLVLDLLRFVLQDELWSTKTQVLEQAVPLCSKTIDLVALPIARASTNKTFAATLDFKALGQLAEEIDVERVLELLHDLCNAASLDAERNEALWKHLESHFVLLMLNKATPVSQIVSVLQMLRTSARDTRFGTIPAELEKQPEQERQIIDRLTNLLFEQPEAPKGEPPYEEDEVLELRLQVLRVFRKMCQTDHGGMLLAQHRSAIGRLVRFLDGQVNKLYRARPSLALTADRPTSHRLLVTAVNLTVRILYHFLRTFEDSLDIVPKLNVVHGGYHKFLVSLTRIALSEQLVFEEGIEDEVAEAAHNILDSVLGPEDGEAVMKAFETPRGTKGSTTEKATTSGGQNGSDSQQEGDAMMSDPG